jgi:hypothetical protein
MVFGNMAGFIQIPSEVGQAGVASDASELLGLNTNDHRDCWLLRVGRERSGSTAKRKYGFSPADVNCHLTLSLGSYPCNRGTIPRSGRAVCAYFTLGTTKI